MFAKKVSNKHSFTLVEILIILVILGVISTLALPTIYNRIQGYANKRTHMVFYDKLLSSLQMMQGANAIVGYTSTEDFVEQLKKYIKIGKVCGNDELTSCFPKTIKKPDGEELEVKNGLKMRNFRGNRVEDENNTNVMGVILQDGTNILLAYNPTCRSIEADTKNVNLDCLSLIYDINSNKKPNMLGEDFSYKVSLGEKEDNSNIGKIKDISKINGEYFGKVLTETRLFNVPTFVNETEALNGKEGVKFTPTGAYRAVGRTSRYINAYIVGCSTTYYLTFDFGEPVNLKSYTYFYSVVSNSVAASTLIELGVSNNATDWVLLMTAPQYHSARDYNAVPLNLPSKYRFARMRLANNDYYPTCWSHSLGGAGFSYERDVPIN